MIETYDCIFVILEKKYFKCQTTENNSIYSLLKTSLIIKVFSYVAEENC